MSSKEKGYELTYEETRFFGLLKISKISILKTWSILWAFLFTILILGILYYFGNIYEGLILLSDNITEFLFAASASILGIVIAALSIIVALFHESILYELLKSKLLHKYLLPFWKAVILWAISIAICFLIIVFQSLDVSEFIVVLMIAEIFIFFYSLFYTVRLTGLVIELSLQKASIKS